MKNNNKLSFNRFLPLCLIMAIMLSGDVFAADTTPHKVTQPEFDAAIANLQAKIDKLSAMKRVGDHFGGGVVFSVDATGQHGLIVSLADLTDGVDNAIPWDNGVYKVTGATGNGIGAGASNTAIIIAAQAADNPTGIFAAKAAADFSVQEDGVTPCAGTAHEICYGDWYLPSRHELNLLYLQQAFVGDFAGASYWSSTEYDADNAWFQDFANGDQYSLNYGKSNTFSVRAVRAF